MAIKPLASLVVALLLLSACRVEVADLSDVGAEAPALAFAQPTTEGVEAGFESVDESLEAAIAPLDADESSTGESLSTALDTDAAVDGPTDDAPVATDAPSDDATEDAADEAAELNAELELVEWCTDGLRIQIAITVLDNSKGTPADALAVIYPRIAGDLRAPAENPPADIAVAMTTVASIVTDWEQALAASGWDLTRAADSPLMTAENTIEFEIYADQLFAYVDDACGLGNGVGAWSRSDELAGPPPNGEFSEDVRTVWEYRLSGADFTSRETTCLIDALEYLKEELSWMFDTYGFCGVSLERLSG